MPQNFGWSENQIYGRTFLHPRGGNSVSVALSKCVLVGCCASLFRTCPKSFQRKVEITAWRRHRISVFLHKLTDNSEQKSNPFQAVGEIWHLWSCGTSPAAAPELLRGTPVYGIRNKESLFSHEPQRRNRERVTGVLRYYR